MGILLKLYRIVFTPESTQGELCIDGKHECWTLEDFCRKPGEAKVYGKTCIPEGKYRIVIKYSNRAKKNWPFLLDVPGFEGIRIDIANTAEEIEGCIAVGLSRSPNRVGHSLMAWNRLVEKFKQAEANKEEIWIEIINAPEKLTEVAEG